MSYIEKCQNTTQAIDDIRYILLKTARNLEKKPYRMYTCRENKDAWTPDLSDIAEKMRMWYKINSESGNLTAKESWKSYKKQFRKLQEYNIMQLRQSKMVNLEKLYNQNKTGFWRAIKKFKQNNKREKEIKIKREQIGEFCEYYKDLFSNRNLPNNEMQESVAIKVQEINKEMNGLTYNESFS